MTAGEMRECVNTWERTVKLQRRLLKAATLFASCSFLFNIYVGSWRGTALATCAVSACQFGFYNVRRMGRNIADMRLLAKLAEPVKEN